MSDLIPGSLHAFSNLTRGLTNCVLFTDKARMTRGNRSIIHSGLVRSKKTIAVGRFYDYFNKCPTSPIALLRIALRSDYGIHADTKLTMFGIYSAAMNVAGVGILTFFCSNDL